MFKYIEMLTIILMFKHIDRFHNVRNVSQEDSLGWVLLANTGYTQHAGSLMF